MLLFPMVVPSMSSTPPTTTTDMSLMSLMTELLLTLMLLPIHVLGLAIAVCLILLPESDDNNGSGLSDNGTAAPSRHLSDSSAIVLVSQHVLLTTHADSSLCWLSVSIGG